MRNPREAPVAGAWRWLAGLCAAGTVVYGGCADPAAVETPARPPISETAAPTNGLIGEWKLDESSGTSAVDTKNGYNAAVLGGAAFVGAHLGNGLNLNNGAAGTGGKYAEMPSNAVLDNVQEGNYTISAWFNPTTVPTDASIDNRYWSIVVKAGQHMGLVYNSLGKFSVRHYLTGDVLEQAQASTVYPVGSWYHVAGAVSKTAGTVKIYVNGVLKATTTFTANTTAREYGSTRFRIGRAQTNWAANGKVDQARIYNRELSASEIADLFNETSSATGIPFGLWGTDPNSLPSGTIWTAGVVSNKGMNSILSQLQNAREKVPHLKMWYVITGGNEQDFANGDGSFNLQRWKDTLDKYAAPFNPDGTSSFYDDLLPYIQDSTLQGIVMLDDLGNFTPDPTFAQLEAMATHVELRYPALLTAVRDRATRLSTTSGGAPYAHLDVAWAQFKSGVGSAALYRDDEISAAQGLDLGLVLGINITDGGPPIGTNVPTDSLLVWGNALLASGSSDYACGFLMWNDTYGSLSHPNMTTLANKANGHIAAPCKRRP